MNHTLNAVKKCAHNFKKDWGGYLNPKEILALRDIGCDIDPRDINIAIYWKQKGISNSRWIHFEVNDEFEKIKGKRR